MRRLSLTSIAFTAACMMGGELSIAQPEPQTFDAAFAKAQASIDAMQEARSLVEDLRAQLSLANDPHARAKLQKELDDQVKSVARITTDLARRTEVMLKLADVTSAVEDVNRVRYLQCYLNYENAEYVKAGEQGEFVAKRYPASEVARPCAKIALASYFRLYNVKKVDAAKVSLLAKHIIATWPNHSDATIARDILSQIK